MRTNHEKTMCLQVCGWLLLIWHALHMELTNFKVAVSSAATQCMLLQDEAEGTDSHTLSHTKLREVVFDEVRPQHVSPTVCTPVAASLWCMPCTRS